MVDDWQPPTPPIPPGPHQPPSALPPPTGPAYAGPSPTGPGPAQPPGLPYAGPGQPPGWVGGGPAYSPPTGPGKRGLRWWWAAIAGVVVVVLVGAWLLISSLVDQLGQRPVTARPTQTAAGPSDPAPGPLRLSEPLMSSPAPAPATDRAIPSLPAGGPHHVLFEAWGPTSEQADITLNADEPDEHTYDASQLPWAVEADVDPTIAILSVDVYTDDRRDTPVACRITIDGVVVSEEFGTSWTACWVDVPSLYNR